MFPLRDHQPSYKFPLITVIIIAVNVIVFLIELTVASPDSFIYTFALVPKLVDFSNLISLYPFITSQFLHAGFLHILSNMWFLKIFGDNVEERFGHVFYLLIYLLAGVVGGLVQYIFSPNADIPMLGASGAVAGVLGAYLVFFPKHQIETLIPFGVFSRIIYVPASFMLFYWFVTQLFSGIGSVAYAQIGGVAWWAHIGGFATGWIIAKLMQREGEVRFEGFERDF
jgi:membrane associated rhomboid family serine protease